MCVPLPLPPASSLLFTLPNHYLYCYYYPFRWIGRQHTCRCNAHHALVHVLGEHDLSACIRVAVHCIMCKLYAFRISHLIIDWPWRARTARAIWILIGRLNRVEWMWRTLLQIGSTIMCISCINRNSIGQQKERDRTQSPRVARFDSWRVLFFLLSPLFFPFLSEYFFFSFCSTCASLRFRFVILYILPFDTFFSFQ